MINEKELQKNLKLLAGYAIYRRGMGYYMGDNVVSLIINDYSDDSILISGEVEGGDEYSAELEFNLRDNTFGYYYDCTCPCDYECKHVVAIGLLFIEHYLEFLKGSRIEIGDTERLKHVLLHFFKDIPQNKFDKDINVIEKLASIGVNVDSLPQEVINAFEKSLNIDKNEIIKNPQKSYLDIDIEKDDYNFSDYFLVINPGYNQIDVEIYNKKHGGMRIIVGDLLFNHGKKISKELFNLFTEIKKSSFLRQQNDKILELAYKAKIPVYRDKNRRNKVTINFNAPKIKMSLFAEKTYNEYQKNNHKNFVFEIDHSYKNVIFFMGKKYLIEVNKNKINLHKMSLDAMLIVKSIELRDNTYYFHNEKLFQYNVENDSILKINNLIETAKKYLDLDLQVPEKFIFKEFKTATPVILVDYKKGEEKMEICPTINYGGIYIDVAKTVYYSRARWNTGYRVRNEEIYDSDNKFIIGVTENKITYTRRSERKEINFYRKIVENYEHFGFTKTGKYKIDNRRKIERFLTLFLPRLKAKGYKVHYLHDKIDMQSLEFNADISVDLNTDNDWLYFDADCYLGENKVNIDDLRVFIEDKRKFLETKDGKLLQVTNRKELEKFLQMLDSFYAKEKGGYEGKLYNAPELEDIFTSSKYYNTKIANSFKAFVKEAKSGKPVEKVKLTEKFNKKLRDYQKNGIDWLYFLRKYRFAGILADDMGLGKTFQALVLLQKEKMKNKPSIVICPKTLLYNWQKEAKKFTPDLKTSVIEGTILERKKLIKNAVKNDLLICSYSSFKNDFDKYEKENIKFNYTILDEAQYIKNFRTQTARTVKQINADYRLALTGTPLENNVSEIWSIFDFLMPGFLSTNKNFVKNFQNPIMKDSDKETLNHLRKKTECFMLRRTKKEVLTELPPKIEQISTCILDKEQNILYQEILKNVKSEVKKTVKTKGFARSHIHILAALTKLRQVCNHPALTLKDQDYREYKSGKMDVCMELVDEIVNSKGKVLIFSQFTKMLDILKSELEAKKIKTLYLSGQTRNRQEIIDKFNQDKEKQVFLISLKAGGVGLNLTSADNVIIFDPWWNPSVENQAIDRTHRIGQNKTVHVYRLVTQGTIEEKIIALQNKKKFLFDNLVGESKDLFKKLTWDDIQGLFN